MRAHFLLLPFFDLYTRGAAEEAAAANKKERPNALDSNEQLILFQRHQACN
jgi:hypothetical protein